MSGETILRRHAEQPSLSYTLHLPQAHPKGCVLLTHGYAEHSGRYGEVVDALLARELAVATYDLRGHGRSEGFRGHVERFDEYLADADDLLTELAKVSAWRDAGPPVLLGHSLGGLITFHLALRDPGRFRAIILSSPFFGIALAVSPVKKAAGRLMSRLAPKFGLPSGLHGADLTHDAAKARAYDEDPMLVKNATSRWFTEAVNAHERALRDAPSMMLPALFLVAAADKVASAPATKAVFERVGSRSKELRMLEGQYHEIFNETDRAKWIAMAADGARAFVDRASS
jgi:alpha-beta hydrolase superfamily lysophospholipase